MGRVAFFILFFAFALSMRDVFVSAEEHAHHEDEHDDFAEFGDEKTSFSEGTEEDHVEVREQSSFATNNKPKPIHIKDLPPLRFLYCTSCGYKNAFEQFSQFVREKYPEMPIEGSNYPPAPWKAYLAQAISILKMAFIVVVVTGNNPFENMGFGYPAILQWAHGNKLSACMMSFLLSNMVEQSLLGTGAFEIYLGDEQLWSKIESGRVPSPAELVQMIDSQLALLGKVPASTGFGENFEQVA